MMFGKQDHQYSKGYNLDLQNLRGQAYHGAGNMAGTTNGLAAFITEQYPRALYRSLENFRVKKHSSVKCSC